MWGDADWRGLHLGAQHLYLLLLSHPTLNYAGVADWREGRLAAMTEGRLAEDVETDALELEQAGFVLVDADTEEVLVRSFIKHDGILKQPKLSVSMGNAYAGIASGRLREVVAYEVQKLHDRQPELPAWGAKQVQTILDAKASGIESFARTFTPGFTPSVTPNAEQTQGVPTTTSTKTATSTDVDRRASRLPKDWTPSEANIKFAVENNVDLAHEVGQFRAHALANGRSQKNWDQAFRVWLGNAKKWARPEKPTPGQRAAVTASLGRPLLATELIGIEE